MDMGRQVCQRNPLRDMRLNIFLNVRCKTVLQGFFKGQCIPPLFFLVGHIAKQANQKTFHIAGDHLLCAKNLMAVRVEITQLNLSMIQFKRISEFLRIEDCTNTGTLTGDTDGAPLITDDLCASWNNRLK